MIWAVYPLDDFLAILISYAINFVVFMSQRELGSDIFMSINPVVPLLLFLFF